MKFPITREELQTYDLAKIREEITEEAYQEAIASSVNNICDSIKKAVCSNETRYILKNLPHMLEAWWPRGRQYPYLHTQCNINRLRENIIEKLKETFIGCDILIDPLHTYLIIDWSK